MSRFRDRVRLLPFVLLALLSPAAVADAGPDLTSRLDGLFTGFYAADEPGAAVLVKKGDEVLLRKGYGMADLELGVAVEPDMIFRLGSITKQFTAVAVMKLVEKGELSLDETLAEMLPDYPDVYDGRVTLRHLLAHTSGIPSYTSMPEFWEKAKDDHTVAEMLDYFDEKELEFEPGSRWVYNNSGYFLLGAILEQASGVTYADFMERELFKPLGLSSTSYGDPGRVVPRRVEGYQPTAEGEYRVADYISMTAPYAAGSLLSSVDDLARWKDALEAVHRGGDGPLSKKTLDRMWTEEVLADGSEAGYGFGWQLGELQGSRVIHHGGGIHGFATHALWLPEEDVFVAVLSNGYRRPPALASVQAAALVLGRPFPRNPAKVGTGLLRSLEGVYRIDDETERVVRVEDGRLTTQRTGGAKLAALPASATEFFYEDSLTTFSFELDEAGRPTAMVMKPWDGNPERAERTDKPLTAAKEAMSLTAEQMDRLTGVYELQPSFLLEVRREGDALVIQATGQPSVPVSAASPTELFNDAIGGRLVFELEDGDTKARSLTLYQAGQVLPAPRVEKE